MGQYTEHNESIMATMDQRDVARLSIAVRIMGSKKLEKPATCNGSSNVPTRDLADIAITSHCPNIEWYMTAQTPAGKAYMDAAGYKNGMASHRMGFPTDEIIKQGLNLWMMI